MSERAPTLFRFLDEHALLKVLWPRLEQVVNAEAPAQAISHLPEDDAEPDIGRLATEEEQFGPAEWAELRRMLEVLVSGRSLGQHYAPAPLGLETRDGKPRWRLVEPQNAEARRQLFFFTIGLLGLPALRPLLRQCSQCGRFFLGTRAHNRPHTFCSPDCRFAFHRSQRVRTAQAEYMKEYRALNRTRRQRAKRKGSSK